MDDPWIIRKFKKKIKKKVEDEETTYFKLWNWLNGVRNSLKFKLGIWICWEDGGEFFGREVFVNSKVGEIRGE